MALVEQLLAKYPLVSTQVSPPEVQIILSELEKVLSANQHGSVVELGCYIGTTSLFIRRMLDRLAPGIKFHVYDSFEGLPDKASHDQSPTGEQFVAGELAASKKAFLRGFAHASLAPPIVHKKWFRDLLPTDMPESIMFAFLDGDYYESIRDSLAAIEPKLADGAVIIIDDYANEALPGAAVAVDEWCRRKGQSIRMIRASLAVIDYHAIRA